jgi:flagellar protein FlaG
MEISGLGVGAQTAYNSRQQIELQSRTTERIVENRKQQAQSQQRVTERISVSRDEIHQKIQEAVDRMDTYSGSLQKKFKYTINDDIDQVVVKIIDPNTDKVIKELPAAEIQKLQARIQEYLGLLIDKTI